jgi:two-component system phosphate regulon sensor histidine kinase PhoR
MLFLAADGAAGQAAGGEFHNLDGGREALDCVRRRRRLSQGMVLIAPQSPAGPPETPWSRTRAIGVAAAAAIVVGAVLMVSQAEILRPLGIVLCIGAAAAVAWGGWTPQESAPPLSPPAPAEPAAPPRADQFGPVLDALPDPALLIDSGGRVAAANAGARRMLGFATSGLRLSAVLRRPELLDAADTALAEGASLSVDYEISAPVEEHFKVFVAPAKLGASNVALMVFQDQTTTINTDRMRADFLANASHELRTPLAALTLLLETLSGHAKNDPAAQERFLKMMHVQAGRMRELIDDLLSLSKIELNEHVPPSEQVGLVALVKGMIEKLGPLAADRGVTFALRAEAPELTVIGDRSQLSQVAQNLIHNAIKYSAEGGVIGIELGLGVDREEAAARAGRQWAEANRVPLLTPPPAAGRAYVFMRVSDSGAGIARRHLTRLSERFYRVEREEGAEQSGTGLGLAIVKHIVNRHRGGFVVESEQGKGSAFAVYLERAPQGALERAPEKAAAEGAAAPSASS